MVSSIKRRNLDIICIVLGADTKKIRTTDSVKLIEYIFSNYEYVNISAKIQEEFESWKKINEGRINIEKGIKKGINLSLEEYSLECYPIKKNTENKINIEINADLNLVAPIYKNTKIGEVTLLYNNNIILKIGIIADEDIKKKGMLDYIFEIIKDYSYYLEKVI